MSFLKVLRKGACLPKGVRFPTTVICHPDAEVVIYCTFNLLMFEYVFWRFFNNFLTSVEGNSLGVRASLYL